MTTPMTTTAAPRRSRDELLATARAHVGTGPVPSTETLRQLLHVRRETAADVRTTLDRERTEQRAARRRSHRAALAAMPRRKRPGRRPMVVAVPLPELAPAPATELAVPAPAEVTGTVRDEATAPAADAADTPPAPAHRVVVWPLLVIACSPFIAIWGGWVGLGKLTGFGFVNLLPGIVADGGWATLDTAITLPLGMEAYSAFAFYVWLHPAVSRRARRFAAWTALGAVVLGMAGQTAYHLMIAAGMTAAPWWITTIVSCIPVAVFGLAAALVHMVRAES